MLRRSIIVIQVRGRHLVGALRGMLVSNRYKKRASVLMAQPVATTVEGFSPTTGDKKMTTQKTVRLPDELMQLAREHEGVREVTVPAHVLVAIDQPFNKGLSDSLLAIRERERSASVESLNLRVR